MLENNNIVQFIFTFLPALIYAFVIFMSAPYRSIKMKVAFFYFLMGILSAVMVGSWHFIFPNWGGYLSTNVLVACWVLATVQVGALEEGMKFLMFKVGENYRDMKSDSPVSTMFYCMSAAAGFAVFENLGYLQASYSDVLSHEANMTTGNEVMLIRAFTAIIMHLICGLMMGYFVAKGRMDGNSVAYKLPFKDKLFALLGILMAVFYHGLYDFNLFIRQYVGNGSYPIFFILVPGLIVSYLMFRDLTWKPYKK